MTELNRRDFMVVTATALGACMACPLHAAAVEQAKKEPVDVGVVADFPKEGIYDRWAKDHSFFLVRKSRRLYAVSATCTHKRFGLVENDGQMKCPKHGSIFDTSGKPTKAPARKPLPRYGIAVNGQGRIIVEPSKEFGEKQWNASGSYLAI